ncbi:nucleoside diphosphate kinase regulator [Oceanibacterium hippocampi]|nr:nucleoside diphosphate kinase regulator [Oceanibacterium hippocampi]
MTEAGKLRPPGAPEIAISEDDIAHIEALAERALQRNPALAARLLDEIGRARVVPAGELPKNVVSIGSTVIYRDDTTGYGKTVTLVYPEDADMTRRRVSVVSPIGVALLGLAEGEAFYWNTRDNRRRMLTVISVHQPSETVEDEEW